MLLSDLNVFSFAYVPRELNLATHKLSRYALTLGDACIFVIYETPPDIIQGFLAEDLM